MQWRSARSAQSRRQLAAIAWASGRILVLFGPSAFAGTLDDVAIMAGAAGVIVGTLFYTAGLGDDAPADEYAGAGADRAQ